MSDLIDRQDVLDALSNAVPSLTTPDGCGQFDRELQIVGEAFVDAMQIVHALPAASPWHRVEEPPKEEGRYWCATKFAGHWIFYAAWYWNNVSDYIGAPVGEGEKADGFVFSEDVVYPDYWMPIEPPKEDA